jgi:AcrR family transcriptional regulator
MDEIAKRAKIGPGTLYRHFPTRATNMLRPGELDTQCLSIRSIGERPCIHGEYMAGDHARLVRR